MGIEAADQDRGRDRFGARRW